jgi:type II secretory pathway pseudopilin PulG
MRRQAISLLEILVVLAIIALLLGLLLPAIQSIRVKSLEISNCNHLKQMALATNSFAGDHSSFLPSIIAYNKLKLRSPIPFVLMMPYLEQSSLYNAFTGDPLSLFNAPKDGYRLYFNPLDNTSTVKGNSTFGADINVRTSYAENFYAFYQNGTMNMTDGTSNSILFAEHLSICGNMEYLYPEIARTCFANPYTQANPQMLPLPQPFQLRPITSNCDPALPNTSCKSGMYCAMADGHVKLFSPSVSKESFWWSVTTNGGEVIAE